MEQATSVGVFTTDRDLVIRSWDPWLAAATGLSSAVACGVRLEALFPELVERGLLGRLRRVVETGGVEVFSPAFHKYVIPCAPREASSHFDRMRQHVTVSPLRSGAGVTGIVVTIEDVTPRLDRERELARELESQDEAIRLRAVQSLAAAETTPSLLTDALADRSWRVRRAAAEGVAAHGGSHAVATLIEALREHHRDLGVLNAALTALSNTQDDVAMTVASLLAVEDADVRTYAALALGLMEDARAVPFLLRALSDSDVNVRYHAIEALGRIRERSAAESLVAIAEQRDFFLSFAALDALALIGEPSVASRLVPLLDDPMLAGPVATCLGAVATEDMAASLARQLSRNGAPIVEIANALSAIYDRIETNYGAGAAVADLSRGAISADAAKALVAAIPRASDADLDGLVVTLGWLSFEGIDRSLARLLAHSGVRSRVANVLVARGERAVEPIVEIARDGDDEVRKLAAMALGRIGSARAVPFLIDLLSSAPDVIVAAAGASGSIGDRAAFEPLLSVLDHGDPSVRQAAVSALNSIGHPAMADRVLELLSDGSPRIRESAARIAGYFGYATCLHPMIALCADRDELVRRAAVEHLANFEHSRAFETISRVLRADPSVAVRAAAARALGHVPDASAQPALLTACTDENMWVRYYAVRALARHATSPDAHATLSALAEHDPMPPVRIAAIEGLSSTNATASMATVLRAAEDSEPEIVHAAIRALGSMPGNEQSATILREALASDESAKQRAALESVARQRSVEWVDAIRRIAESARGEVGQAAIDTLAAIGSPNAIAALVRLASILSLRSAIVAVLSRLDEDQIPHLATHLESDSEGLRCLVIEVLGRTRHASASRLVASALDDPSPAVRLAATQALRRLDMRDAEGQLALLARTDASLAVRLAAQEALERT